MYHRLDALERIVRERTDTAVEIVRTCKGCVSPFHMVAYTEIASKDAACILKKADEFVKKEIAAISTLKAEVLHENNLIVKELMRKFENEHNHFMNRINFCVGALKKLQKREKT